MICNVQRLFTKNRSYFPHKSFIFIIHLCHLHTLQTFALFRIIFKKYCGKAAQRMPKMVNMIVNGPQAMIGTVLTWTHTKRSFVHTKHERKLSKIKYDHATVHTDWQIWRRHVNILHTHHNLPVSTRKIKNTTDDTVDETEDEYRLAVIWTLRHSGTQLQ